jgi:hypothetical protein
MSFIRNTDIDGIAEQRLAEYERKTLKNIRPPIPLEKVLAQVYGLTVLWDEIDELPGETVLGGLKPEKRLIVLNESRRKLFEEKPGLERSTLGHEAGHWEFDVDKGGIDYPRLFDRPDLVSGQRSSGTGEIEVFAGTGCAPKFLDALRQRDTADQERVANRFAAALSMPARLVREAGEEFDFMRWRDLYKMAEVFEVNISALTVRLQQLGFIYIDGNKQFHRSVAEAHGQQQLF